MISRSAVAALVVLTVITPACNEGEAGTSELIQPSQWWSVHPRLVYATLEKVGTYQAWFDVYRLAEGTYAVYEPNQFEEAISYLVLGRERGVLIDAGTGIGNIQRVVQELTDLPVSVVLTHEHYDHIGGAYRFDEIAHVDDSTALTLLAQGRDNTSLQQYVTDAYLWKPLPEGFDPDAWTIPPIEPTLLLSDGEMIDLGERLLEVITTPGHSPGSICLLDRANRLLWTGDHFYPGPLYAHALDVNIADYITSNERLVGLVGLYDHVLSGHNDPWVRSEVIPRVSDAFMAIFEGAAQFSADDGLRRYYFDGFDVLIRSETVERG